MRQPRFLGQALTRGIELAGAQSTDKIAAENDLVSIAPDEAAFRQHVDPPIKRAADLGTETGAREIGRFAGKQTPIEPSRSFGHYLLIEIEIRANGKRDPLSAPRILKATELHNASYRPVAGRIDVGELQMMHTPVEPVHHGKRCSPQLVVEPTGDETADHGFAVAFALERPG